MKPISFKALVLALATVVLAVIALGGGLFAAAAAVIAPFGYAPTPLLGASWDLVVVVLFATLPSLVAWRLPARGVVWAAAAAGFVVGLPLAFTHLT